GPFTVLTIRPLWYQAPWTRTPMSAAHFLPNDVVLHAKYEGGYERVLAPEAVQFVAELGRRFRGRIADHLAARRERQARFDRGERPDFLPETIGVREGSWTIAPVPRDLADRRVEITGPVDRKMIINAMNSGANVFMADFEDSTTPTWDNLIQGQIN